MIVVAGAFAKLWLGVLALAAAQGTLLALVALVAARLVRRPAWRAGLWLVVVAKLALPWGPGLPWSLSDLLARFASHPDVAAPIVPPALAPPAAVPGAWPALGWLALAALWLGGAVFVIARALRSHRAVARAARLAAEAPRDAQAHLAGAAARLGVRAPRLVVGADDTGPHVVGFARPSIVVPPALLASPALLDATLLHELAHVRRRDALARLVQVAAAVLLWWWPVVRFASRRLDAAREAACDAWALEAGDLPRPTYARLLVEMAGLRAAGAALAAPHALDARIAAVLGAPTRARLGPAHKLALIAWVVVALGGARRAEAATPACRYSPELAQALYLAHPEADLDGDGTLSRDEACELQAELLRSSDETVSPLDPEAEAETEAELAAMRAEPLCCNPARAGAYSSPEAETCHSVQGP
ncbi:MAG TPA: M56 family metallopeptidase [Kofleriaceae bacterium]